MFTNYLLRDFLIPSRESFTVSDAQVYKQVTVRMWNKGVVLRQELSGSKIRTKKQFLIHAGQLLLARIGARYGALGIVPINLENAIVSGDFWAFNINKEIIDVGFLGYYISTSNFLNEVAYHSKGTTRVRTEINKFLNIKISLPSLVEQNRIRAHIDLLAAYIAEAQSLRKESMEESQALLYSAMRQVFKPDGLPVVDLETACSSIIDNLHSTPNYSGDCIIPCIRSSDVGWGQLILETARKTSEKEYIHRTMRGEPREGDIVLVREGGGTGKAALVEKHNKFSLGQRVMMLRPNTSLVLPKYFLYQFLSPFIYEEQILPLSKGSASPHLNIGSLRKFRFILPPIDEQRNWVNYLDDIQERAITLRFVQGDSQKELDALLPSILDKAFKGEL